jgi:hypothetical protein
MTARPSVGADSVPTRVHLIDRQLEQCADDVALIVEVVLQVALADAAALGNLVGRDRGALLVEQFERAGCAA